MPRYHVIVKGKDLDAVAREMAITVDKQGGDAVRVDLRAADAKAAKATVKARLPKGSTAKVEDPKQIPD